MRAAPRPVGDLLLRAMPQLRERLLEERIRHAWAEVAGADVARRARPRGLANGCLQVAVDNSPWLHELTLRGAELERRLRERFPGLTSIRFVLGALPEPAASPPPPRPPAPPLAPDEVRDIEATVAPLADPALRTTARRLLTKARQARFPGGTAL